MALHDEQQAIMGAGNVSKTIDEGAYTLMADMVQKYQYQYPERSAVRELLSNALDAVTEKNNALRILNGQAQPSEYYVEREGPLYKNSKWNPDYYDPNWLSQDNDVKITYIERNDQRDLLTIKDYGVGLFGVRLAGYFKLGFSTKRNNVNTLGKYGIGAKSALSTGITSYTVENRYNGMKMLFQVFDHTYQSIIPSVDLATGKENKFIEITVDDTPYKFYYVDTDEKNGLTVSIECKKHKQSYFIDAVKNQMMYFQNINFSKVHAHGNVEYIDHRAAVLYEDDYIILSDNQVYTKPHMLINKVNYGYIDFSELELEQRYGNIGIKVNPETVTINPSRESLIWDDKTRDAVLSTYKKVSDIATDMINESIHTDNFVDWIFSVNDLSDYSSKVKNQTIISRLKEIANMKDVELFFTTYEGKRLYLKDVKDAFAIRTIDVKTTEKAGNVITKLTRTKTGVSALNASSRIFIKTEPGASSNKKDKYLFEKYGAFYILEHVSHAYNYMWYAGDEVAHVPKPYMEAVFALMAASLDSSKYVDNFEIYENVEVEGEFSDEEEDLIEKAVEDNEAEDKGPKEKVVKTTLRFSAMKCDYHVRSRHVLRDNFFNGSWAFYEVEKTDLDKFISPEVYYINHTVEDEALYAKIAWLTKGSNSKNGCIVSTAGYEPDWTPEKIIYSSINTSAFNREFPFIKKAVGKYTIETERITLLDAENITVIRTSQESARHFKQFKHLSLAFAELRNNTIKMSSALIKWNTARLLADKLYKCRFLEGFAGIDREKHEAYKKLKKFVDEYYVPVKGLSNAGFKAWQPGEVEDLIEHCDNIFQFQVLVNSGATPEVIAETAKIMFSNDKVNNAHGADLALIEELTALIEYAEPYQFLNTIAPLCGDSVNTSYVYHIHPKEPNSMTLNNELEDLVKGYMKMVDSCNSSVATFTGKVDSSGYKAWAEGSPMVVPPIPQLLNTNTDEHDVHN